MPFSLSLNLRDCSVAQPNLPHRCSGELSRVLSHNRSFLPESFRRGLASRRCSFGVALKASSPDWFMQLIFFSAKNMFQFYSTNKFDFTFVKSFFIALSVLKTF